VTLSDGRPFSLEESHPTFRDLVAAIKAKKWNEVPLLVNEAEKIAFVTEGLVSVTKLGVTYNGQAVHSSLAERIMAMAKEGKDIKHLLRFMDNLYLNPSERARNSFYDWLTNNDLPITDDGCCLAYKYVDDNLRDTHTHTVDNSPGQTIMMSRKVVDTDYDTQCATGFHICSKQYGTYGTRCLMVKFNPRHILSAVGGKMRVTKYETLMILGDKKSEAFSREGYAALEKKLVIEVKKERREMVEMLLADKTVQRLIRNKKIKKLTIMKSPYGRLKAMVQKYGLVPAVGPEEVKFLQAARKAAKLTTIQVAKRIGIKPTTYAKLEEVPNPTQEEVDRVLEAISGLTGNRHVTYPKPVAVAKE
jgi:hypothetical protein